MERILAIRLNPEGVPLAWLRADKNGPATAEPVAATEGTPSGLRRRGRASGRKETAPTSEATPSSSSSSCSSGTGNQPGFSEEDTRRLMLTGIITAVGISLHNLPEGLVVYTATISGMCDPAEAAEMTSMEYVSKCFGRGLSVALAIALHNIPEGMAVAVPIMGSTGRCEHAPGSHSPPPPLSPLPLPLSLIPTLYSKWQALKWCLLSSLCEPAAAVVFGYFFNEALTPQLLAVTNAAVAGIMIMLCLVELLPAALRVLSPLVRTATLLASCPRPRPRADPHTPSARVLSPLRRTPSTTPLAWPSCSAACIFCSRCAPRSAPCATADHLPALAQSGAH